MRGSTRLAARKLRAKDDGAERCRRSSGPPPPPPSMKSGSKRSSSSSSSKDEMREAAAAHPPRWARELRDSLMGLEVQLSSLRQEVGEVADRVDKMEEGLRAQGMQDSNLQHEVCSLKASFDRFQARSERGEAWTGSKQLHRCGRIEAGGDNKSSDPVHGVVELLAADGSGDEAKDRGLPTFSCSCNLSSAVREHDSPSTTIGESGNCTQDRAIRHLQLKLRRLEAMLKYSFVAGRERAEHDCEKTTRKIVNNELLLLRKELSREDQQACHPSTPVSFKCKAFGQEASSSKVFAREMGPESRKLQASGRPTNDGSSKSRPRPRSAFARSSSGACSGARVQRYRHLESGSLIARIPDVLDVPYVPTSPSSINAMGKKSPAVIHVAKNP